MLVGTNVLVGGGVRLGVRLGIAVLPEVGLATAVYDPAEMDCAWGVAVLPAPVMGETVLVVVRVGVTATTPCAVEVVKDVEEGTGVAVRGTAGEFVGVKKRMANASRVRARSRGVGVGVNLGVRTISGRVSSLSPPSANGR